MITKEQKAAIIKEHGGTESDSGRAEVQVALHTARISDLTKHLATNKKDNHTRRGLIMLVAKRRKLLNYMMKKDVERYRSIIAALKLRK